MRILIATDAFPPKIDGVADTSAILARKLAERGHFVGVVAPAPGGLTGPGYRVARIASTGAPRYAEVRLSLALDRVWRIARGGGWDAAIVPTPGPIGMTATAALPRRVRMVNIYTTDIPRYLDAYRLGQFRGIADRMLRWMAERAVFTLCPTAHVRGELAARGYPRLDIWGRGVDNDLFRPNRRSAAMRTRLSGGDSTAPIALFVGRLAREKRLEEILAAARLTEGVHFAFVGDGPQRAQFEREFRGLPARFLGYLRGEELGTAFASADMFVFPSDTETFGQVVLQAMASGIPPIVATETATTELVPEGIAGLHVPAGASGPLAAAIMRLAGEPALRRAMGAAAAECARRYSWDALVSRMEEMLAGRAPQGDLSERLE